MFLGASLLLSTTEARRPWFLISGRLFAVIGAVLHGVAIGLRCIELKHPPFTTPAESLSLLAWVVVLVYLGLEVFWKLWAAGPFALGLSFLMVVLGAVWSGRAARTGQDAALLGENAVSLHILATISAMGAFALAFCCAALYLVLHHILKSKQGLVWMKRLPPLKTVETAAFTLVALGFPLLSLGILSGMARAMGGGLSPGWATDPKTLMAYLVWGVYGVYLIARLLLRWSPVRTAYILLVGLVLCLILLAIPSAAHQFGEVRPTPS
jgi:ABC-type uncharacterized transport system permease subunit